MNGNRIGRRVVALRKERGLTMRDLSELTGLSQGHISRLENGRQGFRAETLIRIAEALGVEPYRLLLSTEEDAQQHVAPALGGALCPKLTEALRDPTFVSLLGDIAAAYRGSHAKFRAIETLIGVVLGKKG